MLQVLIFSDRGGAGGKKRGKSGGGPHVFRSFRAGFGGFAGKNHANDYSRVRYAVLTGSAGRDEGETRETRETRGGQ